MLSKLFGSKSQPPKSRKFFPENRLEALLMQAATDFAARTEFIKELLDTDVFILIVPQENQTGQFEAQQGDTMQIKGITLDGKRIIPIFSSERRLREFITTLKTLEKWFHKASSSTSGQSASFNRVFSRKRSTCW